MKRLLGGFVLYFALIGTGYAQSDPFDGTWKLDVAKSTSPGGRPLPKEELIILKISDNAEECTNDITSANGTRYRSRYKATYNDGKWYPSKNLETGEESGARVMMIRFDERSELRAGQDAAGKFGGMILRRVAEDGKTMHVMWYGEDGKIIQDLMFDRQ